MSYQDKMYLDEIKANDIAMVENVIQKECKHYKFPYSKTGAKQVNKFIGIAVDKALRSCGVNIIPVKAMRKRNGPSFLDLSEKSVEQLLQKNKTKIETRAYDKKEDEWRSGTYIYKDDILAYFISLPGTLVPGIISLDQSKWLVIKTNVKM